MIRTIFLNLTLLLLTSALHPALAQDQPIGNWRSHYPYNSAYGVATDGDRFFIAAGPGFYEFKLSTIEMTPYSKVNGMADVNTRKVAFDILTNTVIIGYDNSNIDLFQNQNFYNLPDLKLKSISGSKTIRNIYADQGMAYISTDVGLLVVNLTKREVKETWVFSESGQNIPIRDFSVLDNYFYAATRKGLYRIDAANPAKQVFTNWQRVPGGESLLSLATVQNRLYAAGEDSLFQLNGGSINFLFNTGSTILGIDPGAEVLYINRYIDAIGKTYVLDANNQLVDSIRNGLPRETVEDARGTRWIADQYIGFAKVDPNRSLSPFRPQGPNAASTYDILAYNKEVWLAHGSYNALFGPTGNGSGISHFNKEDWKIYSNDNYPLFGDSMRDVINLAKDPINNFLYAGSLSSGLFELSPSGVGKLYKQGSIQNKFGENLFPIGGMAFDKNGLFWITQPGAIGELAVRNRSGQWTYLQNPNPGISRKYPYGAFGLLIDDFGQKWYAGLGDGGAILYNDNSTPELNGDDRAVQLLAGKGSGGLPSNVVLCFAKDRDGSIWIGTDNGIGIVSCPGNVLDGSCEAEWRVVQYDQFAGELFKEQQVLTIAVDGANRKWVGTGNGVWLISPDASKIIYRFTAANSPLPSDVVQKITVDPITGDVYMGTQNGMVSFRGTATDAKEAGSSSIVSFPNPVPSGFAGSIGIRGFTTDADVRITDIAGQLVYRAKANGGQVVWNGMDYTGRRPQTGVYLIFATNRDGTETQVGKLLFNQ